MAKRTPNPGKASSKKRSVRVSPAKVKRLSEMAQTIDAEEKAELLAWARDVFERHQALQEVIQALKAERQAQGLSLADIDARTGIGRSNLCRLENAADANPTIDTLQRYADALNKHILITLSDASPRPSRNRRAG